MAKILVVDDQESVLKTVESILKKAGHEIHPARDGYIALERLANDTFDLLITDANMPGISGFDLVKYLRLNERTRGLPIMMLTGRQEKRDVEKAIQAKVDDYILKPIEPDVLTGKVAVLLARLSQSAPVDVPVNEDVDVKLGIRIAGVHENGLRLVSNLNLATGTRFTVASTLWKKIGIPAQEVRVIESRTDASGHSLSVQFVSITAGDLARLLDWITHQSKSKSA